MARHFVTCSFMWSREKMPRSQLVEKDLQTLVVKYFTKKMYMCIPRKILKQDDLDPGTKKGKLDQMSIWIVQIRMS